MDHDPRRHAGHAHWQRRPFGNEPAPAEPVSASVYLELVERSPTLASQVAKLLLAMLLLVAGFGAVLQPRLFSGIPIFGEIGVQIRAGEPTTPAAGPIVTILLLLFPVLLSRLDRSAGNSILGRLRRFSYYLAYTAGIVAVFLALCVASVPVDYLEIPFLVAIVTLIGLLALVVANAVAKARTRRRLVPASRLCPRWLAAELWPGRHRARRCELNFSTVQRDDHG